MDKGGSVVSALGVKDGLIAFVGNNADFEAAEVIDLKGALMLPGFCDSHLHLVGYAFAKNALALYEAKSKKDMLEMLSEHLKSNKDAKFIYGRGFNDKDFADKTLPVKAELDSVCPDIPVQLSRVCGHMGICNSKTIELIKSLPGYENEAHNIDEENGFIYEGAMGLFFKTIPAPTVETVKGLIRSAMNDLNRCGITSAQSDDFGALPGGNPQRIIEAYKQLENNGEITVRVYEQCLFSDSEKFAGFLNAGYRTGLGGDFFKIGPLKILLDGSLGARTAALLDDYSDAAGNRGLVNLSPLEFNRMIALAKAHNMQIAVHGIGDRAIEMIINGIEKHFGPCAELRHGIVHAQITNPVQLQRMKNLGIMAYIQPVFLDSDLHIAEQRLGTHRTKTSYAFRSMTDMGILVSGGSDAPVCPFDVMENIYFAVTRKDLCGFPENGWLPEERLTVEQAVRLFTTNAAYCSFSENIRGTLEVGKQADLVVLGEDIFNIAAEKIKDVSVLRTVVGGKTVYLG